MSDIPLGVMPAKPGLDRYGWALVVVLAAFALLPVAARIWGSEAYVLSMLTRVMVFAIAAMSLNLIIGFGGLVSFGHAAFVGIGAYSVAILSSHGIDDLLIQVPVALVAAALFALATGAVSLRTEGVYFIMITLAFGQMAFFFMTSLAAYGGDDGLTLAGRSRIAGLPLIARESGLYWLTLGCLAAVYLLSAALVRSRFGRVVRGTRDNGTRMMAIGFAPFRYRLVAYVISGALGSLAGCLLANQAEFVSPAYMTWQRSGEFIFIVVLGGIGSLVGPIVGAAVFLLVEENLSRLTEHWALIFGPFLILVVLFARGGIAGLLRRRHV